MDNFEGVGQGVFDIGFVGVEKSLSRKKLSSSFAASLRLRLKAFISTPNFLFFLQPMEVFVFACLFVSNFLFCHLIDLTKMYVAMWMVSIFPSWLMTSRRWKQPCDLIWQVIFFFSV